MTRQDSLGGNDRFADDNRQQRITLQATFLKVVCLILLAVSLNAIFKKVLQTSWSREIVTTVYAF